MVQDNTFFQSFPLMPESSRTSLSVLSRHATRVVERVLKWDDLGALYEDVRGDGRGSSFVDRVLDKLGVRADIAETDRQRVPVSGPLVVVCNHPFGFVEGLLLERLLRSVRTDIKILGNRLLAHIPECRDLCILVDPFGGVDATRRNLAGLREAIRWVRGGGVLVTFPSGEVSRFNMRSGSIRDAPWKAGVAGLIRRACAAVLPVHIEGANSPLFQLGGFVHPRLGTAMLPMELTNKRNRTIRISIGQPVSARRVAGYPGNDELIRYLRLRTDVLAHRRGTVPHPARRQAWPSLYLLRPGVTPGAPAEDRHELQREVRNLPDEQVLVVQDDFQVFYAMAGQIPRLLSEIGRLRESTFRQAGEGTGHARDLDRFDNDYLHLMLWNTRAKEVAGAYRMGLADIIVGRRGLRGLYANTLFRLRRPLLDRLQPAIELGRSFVCPEYQREYLPLLLLWKGIGHFIGRYPRYRHLFGAVSISDDYAHSSRLLLQHCLRPDAGRTSMAQWVRARHPLRSGFRGPRLPEVPPEVAGDLDVIEELVADIENGRSLPVLLRQYLKLGGKVLGFNVDPSFHSVLDALIVVDFVRIPLPVLARYMGKESARQYTARHKL